MSFPASAVIRADASTVLGSGHVMRCLTLADRWKRAGTTVTFVCRDTPGHLAARIAHAGFAVSLLPPADQDAEDEALDAEQTMSALGTGAKADWVVVDHYALGARWEACARGFGQRLLAIDDLADRRHEADVLLDQNLGRTPDHYAALLPACAHRLIGPSYALLRPEFAHWRPAALTRRRPSRLHHILVTMGGADPNGITAHLMRALAQLGTSAVPAEVTWTIVMGGQSDTVAEVKALAASLPWPMEVRLDVNNMAELMTQADLAIGAAGSSVWERCCLGLPAINVVLAPNQREAANSLASAGAAAVITPGPHGLEDALGSLLQSLVSTPSRLHLMSECAARIADGEGAARVLDALTTACSADEANDHA